MKRLFSFEAVFLAALFLIGLPRLAAAAPSPDSAKSYFEEGIELNKQHRYNEALEKFTKAVNLSLDTHRYHQAVYMTYIAMRRGLQGIQYYKTLAAQHPANGTVHYWLGRFYVETQALEEAVREFREAARLAPRDEHPFVSLGHISLRLGKEKEALEAYAQANKLSPRIAGVHAGLGNIHFRRKRYDEAQKEYETALAIDPSLTEPRYNLGVIYEKKGEIGKAVKQWEKLVEDDPNESAAREKLARVYFLGERYLDAVREYTMLSQVKQSSPQVFFSLGEAQVLLAANLSDPAERRQLMAMAIDAFQRTVELDPKNAQARKYLDRLNAEMRAATEKETKKESAE